VRGDKDVDATRTLFEPAHFGLCGHAGGAPRGCEPGTAGASWYAAPLSYARYRVALETPQTIFRWQDAAVVVHVQNGQGLPADGIPVTFQVDPAWARYVSIRPARALTQGGRVRVMLWADMVGLVWITARVGTVTQRAAITVVMPIATGYGPAVGCRSQPWEADGLPGLLRPAGDCA